MLKCSSRCLTVLKHGTRAQATASACCSIGGNWWWCAAAGHVDKSLYTSVQVEPTETFLTYINSAGGLQLPM